MDFAEILTNESVLCFTDGQTIKGANEVGAIIMKCCKGYSKGITIGLVAGSVIGCAAVYTTRYVVRKVKAHKNSIKEVKTEA